MGELEIGELVMTGEAGQLVHVATFLPVRHWWHVIPFLRMASRVQKQAKTSQGAVTYQVRAAFRKKHFWTYSVWRDRASMARFVGGEPHATAIKRFPHWAGEGAAFVEWTSTKDSIDWDDAVKRLEKPTFYYKQPNA